MSILPPKNTAVRVRLTEADRDVLVKQAQRSGVALSVIIRRAIRQFIQGQTPEQQRKAVPSKFLGSSDGSGGA